MIKFNFNEKMSLKVAFAGLVLIVNIILVGLVLYFSSLGNKYTSLKLLEKFMGKVARGTTREINFFFNTSYQSIEAAKITIEKHDFGNDNNSYLVYLKKILLVNKSLSLAYFGREDGSFFMVKRMGDLSFSYAIFTRTPDSIVNIWLHENPEYSKTLPNSVQSLVEGYDPRVRPWYIKARKSNKIIMTEAYIYTRAEEKNPRVSIARSINGEKIKGAIGLDFNLITINSFLASLPISKVAAVYIIDTKEQIIAYSLPDSKNKTKKLYKEVKNQNGNSVRMLTLADLNNQKINKIYQLTKSKKDTGNNTFFNHNIFKSIISSYINFFKASAKNNKTLIAINDVKKKKSKITFLNQKYDGENYLSMLADIKVGSRINSKLGFILPEKAIIGDYQHVYEVTLIIAIILILISIVIFTYLFNTRISFPIMLLSSKMVRMIKNFEIRKGHDFSSSLKEIKHMGEAFESVRKAIMSFARYLPREVVGEIITKDEVAKVGGKNRVLTIFFSDIQDFTKISEDNPSDIVLEKLEEYFNMIHGVISSHKGILDKYIGDAVMAMWGAPHKIDNSAAYACVAAVEIINKLKIMNKKFEAEEFPKFITRIGINTDHVIVGNIGSKNRINYTCLGDGVNLASRLEGLNKFYKTQILVSNKTIQQAKDYVESRLIDRVAVKGKSQRILIHEVIAKKGDLYGDDKKFLETYKEAILFYLDGSWNNALESFTNALKIRPKDYITQLYVERSKEYSQNPPEEGSESIQLLEREI